MAGFAAILGMVGSIVVQARIRDSLCAPIEVIARVVAELRLDEPVLDAVPFRDALIAVRSRTGRLRLVDTSGALQWEKTPRTSLLGFGVVHDTLWFLDSRGTIKFFERSGVPAGVLEVRPLRVDPAAAQILPSKWLGGGAWLGVTAQTGERTLTSIEPTTVVVVARVDTPQVDTIAEFQTSHATLLLEDGQRGVLAAPQPFADTPLIEAVPPGMVYSISRSAEPPPDVTVTRIFPTRDGREAPVRLSVEARHLDDSVVLLAAEHIAVGVAHNRLWASPAKEALVARILGRLYRPRYVPPVERAVGGADGTLWLHLTAHEANGGERWVGVKNAKLRFLDLPAGLRLIAVSNRSFWTTLVGEDEAVVRRFALPPGWCADLR